MTLTKATYSMITGAPANVLDFGAVGDGVTDDTAAINRALYQIYCREVNPQIRRSIFFPAGVYLVTDTILIPPYATLYGEGPDNSVIKLDSTSAAAYLARTADSLQQTGVNIATNGAIPPQSITVLGMSFETTAANEGLLIENCTNSIGNTNSIDANRVECSTDSVNMVL